MIYSAANFHAFIRALQRLPNVFQLSHSSRSRVWLTQTTPIPAFSPPGRYKIHALVVICEDMVRFGVLLVHAARQLWHMCVMRYFRKDDYALGREDSLKPRRCPGRWGPAAIALCTRCYTRLHASPRHYCSPLRGGHAVGLAIPLMIKDGVLCVNEAEAVWCSVPCDLSRCLGQSRWELCARLRRCCLLTMNEVGWRHVSRIRRLVQG